MHHPSEHEGDGDGGGGAVIKLRGEVAALLIVIIVGAAFVPAFDVHVHVGEPLVPARKPASTAL